MYGYGRGGVYMRAAWMSKQRVNVNMRMDMRVGMDVRVLQGYGCVCGTLKPTLMAAVREPTWMAA